MSKSFFLVVLLGFVAAAAAAEFGKPFHFRHRPGSEEDMPPAGSPMPHHRPGHGPGHGMFAHPPRMAEGPDHMPHHHRGHHFPGGRAHPPMMSHGQGPHGMPPAGSPHMHPRHHVPHHEPLSPTY